MISTSSSSGWLGLPIRPGRTWPKRSRRAGVRLFTMTGDHPVTARAIARQIGLSERPELLSGAEIDGLDDVTLRLRLRSVDLRARLLPSHK